MTIQFNPIRPTADKFTEHQPNNSHSADTLALPQLDPARLHFRDRPHTAPNRDISHHANLPQHHPQMPH